MASMDMAFNAAINAQQQQMQQMQQLNALRNQRQMQQAMFQQQGPTGFGFDNGFNGNSGAGFQGTIEDARVGGGNVGWRGGIFGGPQWQPNEGYAIDQNRNGRYDRGRDGVLVFDQNRDGQYDKKDVQSTNNMMQAVQGNYVFNNDGKVSFAERIQGMVAKAKYSQLDSNRDGVLSTDEISRGGGKVWVDQNRSGNIGSNELHSAYNMPNSNGWGPSQRLDMVDPFARTSHTSNNWGFQPQPSPFFGGGGYPGCGCGGGWGGGYAPPGGWQGTGGYLGQGF